MAKYKIQNTRTYDFSLNYVLLILFLLSKNTPQIFYQKYLEHNLSCSIKLNSNSLKCIIDVHGSWIRILNLCIQLLAHNFLIM